MTLTLIHLGQPLPAPRPRLGRWRVFNPPAYTAYKRDLAWAMKEAMKGRPPITAPVAVEMLFYRQGHVKADIDNLMKTWDAGTGIIWHDDAQIREVHAEVFYGSDRPRVEIWVETCPDAPTRPPKAPERRPHPSDSHILDAEHYLIPTLSRGLGAAQS